MTATPPKPFVPRDIFRLLVRLEAQKTNDVDSQSLERRFRVPPGYGKDETEEQRERLAQLITPGPGTYEIPTIWGGSGGEMRKPSAVFSSCAPRDPFQLEAVVKETASLSPMKTDAPMLSYLQRSPPLGSFTKAERGLDSPERRLKSPAPIETKTARSAPAKKWASPGISFERAPRTAYNGSPCLLGPSHYAVKRLWDPSRKTGVATPDLPSPAGFSASKDKRELVWSPARGLPSNAIAEAWDASNHYAKHKRQVLLEQEKQRRRHLSQSKSMPMLGSPSQYGGKKNRTDTYAAPALDPFEYLRRLPHGEQRANALVIKHGLSDVVRPVAAHSTQRPLHDSEVVASVVMQAVHTDCDDIVTSESTGAGPLAAIGERPWDKREVSLSRRGLCTSRDETQDNTTATTTESSHDRITVSCRLQGGFVFSVKMYPAKRVRLLKTAIVRKQTRYQNEDQFDLYLGNGKLLTSMEDTLHQVGLRDRSLVQVVTK